MGTKWGHDWYLILYNVQVKVAEDCGLVVIPLCQTFGHMEYVLKHFSFLRENPERPDCLLPIGKSFMKISIYFCKVIVWKGFLGLLLQQKAKNYY